MGDSVAADSWVWGFLGVNPALFAGAGPATVTRREAEAALASYLARAQAAQGGTALRLTPKVRAAIAGMAKNDQQLSLAIEAGLGGPDTAGDSAHVAAAIAKLLPETLPKESIAHLATAAVDEAKQAPKDIAGKLKEAAKEKLDLATSPDLEQDGRGSPYHNELPPASPPDPNAPTILHIPEQNWDWPKGKKAPRPAPPDVPLAADSALVSAAIATIDIAALVPASLRGKPEDSNYPEAREVARQLANTMDAARSAKQKRADFALSVPYPTPEETKAALDVMEGMVRAVAAALPDRGSPVVQVVIKMLPPVGHKGQGWQRSVDLGAA